MTTSSHDVARRLLTTGGDERIVSAHADGTNRYFASPFPRDTVTYASSTANDISADAFAYIGRLAADMELDRDLSPAAYGQALDALRRRLRAAYGLAANTAIAFAASGTDLEFIALEAVKARAVAGVRNVLLGADEVGSGCILSAHGRYFADSTATGHPTEKGRTVAGLETVDLTEVPVRDDDGNAYDSGTIAAAMRKAVDATLGEGLHPLLHIVHGSKTGLILPTLADIKALVADYGDRLSLVVDACQARVTTEAIHDYLDMGAIVFVTGSKFMGGPPFSGMAFLPGPIAERLRPPGKGMATLFRRAEWPAIWPGRDILPDTANAGLLVRLEAAIFELERFQALSFERVTRIINAFRDAVQQLAGTIKADRVLAHAPDEIGEAAAHPIEMRSLVTLDLGHEGRDIDFDAATSIQKAMIEAGVRLGQPVRCAVFGTGPFAGKYRGTLRVGLSMPQVVALADCDDMALRAALAADMASIAEAYKDALEKI